MSESNPTERKRNTPPRWLLEREGLTTRQWKAKKRREFMVLWRAFETFRLGCAYTPMRDGEIGKTQDLMESMYRRISVKEWGR